MLQGDSQGYLQLASGLRTGCGFARRLPSGCDAPEVARTPGYPLLLAVAPSLRSVIILQALLGGAVCLAVGTFALSKWGSRAGIIAEVIAGFDLPSIYGSTVIMSDCLFAAFLCGAVVLQLDALRRSGSDRLSFWECSLAALLVGATSLVRPVGAALIVLAPVPVLLLRASRNRTIIVAQALMVLTLAAAPVALWTLRNYELRGIRSLSTLGAVNLYYYNAGGVVASLRGEELSEAQQQMAADLIGVCPPVAANQSPISVAQEIQEPCLREMKRRATAIMLAHPWRFLRSAILGVAWTLFGPGQSGAVALLDPRTAQSTRGGAGIFGPSIANKSLKITLVLDLEIILLAFAWLGVIRAVIYSVRFGGRDTLQTIMIPLIASVLMIMPVASVIGYSRFRLPLMPLVAIVAAAGWSRSLRIH
jgi:4-amino-4-deoxy-L-arabinose transferase-like glycosyltransferase